ncbi:MAG: efflux RND transporter periplasmic adaptor subunit [Muribaculaceae bacterium]|nr:efflux RND transporter periplasmic adaptor subunit [Muribaculaceae bacterium]
MIRLSHSKRTLLSGTIAITVIISGCKNHDRATEAGPVRVNVEVVGEKAIADGNQIFSGTVEASEESTVSFSVPGTITKVYVEEGQKVSKGQVIAHIKSESLVNSRNIAQAELEEARDAYQRLKKLHDADALPDVKWVEIQSKLKQAENAAALADRAVADASIHAPISGYVSQKFAGDGQTVIPAEPVVKIVNLNSLQVSIPVPENEISSFGPKTTAVIKFDIEDNPEVIGKIGNKSVVADPLTRSYTVKFDIDNVNGKILPGMIGDVVVKGLQNDSSSVKSSEITLPSQAVLLSSDNHQFVWTVKNGKAQRKDVVADELSANGVIVKSGLVPGDSIIVAGMQKVSTGTEVTVVR